MTGKARTTTRKAKATPAPKPTEPTPPASATAAEPAAPAARTPDPRREVVTVGECMVPGCPVLEFEPGRGLCMDHFTTRLDLREVARHDR
ncbi:hypothetical protein [Amycolatopsis jiangsuensis]|uniref:Uncharacterized protein n=1 Tax=Amycolatopsis jiangsuensis TaxID=1181879 RepID=A0A840J731_9PSEU|nr:hypothetical protein [Amycolatopsis jiangsuensis]MBB4689820.1 hypothetical protein [Amycolatopsis jiangsuensis]